jgi:hypothetical protein
VVTDVGLVLDTDVLLVYAGGSDQVGLIMSKIADVGSSVLVPATCLASAYRDGLSVSWPYLDVLSSLPYVVVAPLEHDQCAVLGGWARSLGLDLAHAAMEAAAHPIVPLMTAHRERVTEFLPKQWPIIDV